VDAHKHVENRGGNPTTELQVIARHTIAQDNASRVCALSPHLIAAARSEPGNLAFDAYPKLNDRANYYVLLERYTSLETFEEHREASHFELIVLGKILPLLSNRVIEQYDVAEDARAAFG
jgi:quinol monooxygenase YgiN